MSLDNNHNPKDYNIVSTLGAENENAIFCDSCNLKLLENRMCPRCGQYYFEPAETKHEVKITGLHGETETDYMQEPLTSIVPENWNLPKSDSLGNAKDMTRAYKLLEQKGFHFTSYTDSSKQ